MRHKIKALTIAIIFLSIQSIAQTYDRCNTDSSFQDRSLGITNVTSYVPDATPFVPYGKVFTPKGSIKFLVIYAEKETFVDHDNNPVTPPVSSFNSLHPQYYNGTWPQVDASGLPATKTFPYFRDLLFYTDNNQFTPNNTDYNVSTFYYNMSLGNFLVTADYFPEKINIPAGHNESTFIRNFIQTNYPTFDWSPYDQRTNFSNFITDNSLSSPDGYLDYVIVIYRDLINGNAYAGNSITGVVSPCPSPPFYLYTMCQSIM